MELNIFEKFFLLAQHQKYGRFTISNLHLNYNVIGIALMKMAYNKTILIENKRVVLKSYSTQKDVVLPEVQDYLLKSKKPRSIRYWINKISRKSNKFRWEILNSLSRNNIIRIEHKKFLGLIPYRRHYLQRFISREKLVADIRSKIVLKKELSQDDVILIGAIESTKMHKVLTPDKDELKAIKKQTKIILKESAISETVDATIRETQAAIGAVMIATTIVTTS